MAIRQIAPGSELLPALSSQTKTIQIRVAGTGVSHDIMITPGTTPAEILTHLGLTTQGDQPYNLSPGQGQQVFDNDKDLYPQVNDEDVLWATLPVDVGAIFPPKMDAFLQQLLRDLEPSPIRIPPNPYPRPAPRPTKPAPAPRKRLRVSPSFGGEAYWKQAGWERHGNTYTGHYKLGPSRSWTGRIEVGKYGVPELFIQNPLEELRGHAHWACFQERRDGWFFIHTNRPVPDVSAGILQVEQLLKEALTR